MSDDRWLARRENLSGVARELDWINSRTGILGESFGMATRSIQDLIDDGSMVVVPPPRDRQQNDV